MIQRTSAGSVIDDAADGRAVYLYCVGHSDALDALGPVGIAGGDVRMVRSDGLAALVSDLSADAHVDVGLPSRASLLAHEFVISAAMRRRTVVPVAYGLVVRSDADVLAVLAAACTAIDGVLEALADRVQVGLRVVRRPDAPLADGDRPVTDLYEALRGVAAANRARTPIGERMLRNVSFLVDRANLDTLAERVEVLRARHDDTVEYRMSEPCAPCDFVRVRLRVDRPDAAGSARGHA